MATAKLQHPVVRKPRDGLWYKAALVGGHEKLAEQVGPKVSPYRIKILWSWSDPNEVSKHKAMPTGCELVLIAGHFLNAETIQKTRMLANKSNARYVQVVTGSVSCIDMGLKTLGLFPNPEWARDLEVVDRATFMSQAKGQAPMVPSIAEVVPVVPLDHPVAVRCSVKRHPTPLLRHRQPHLSSPILSQSQSSLSLSQSSLSLSQRKAQRPSSATSGMSPCREEPRRLAGGQTSTAS